MWSLQLKIPIRNTNEHVHVPERCEVLLWAERVQPEENLDSERRKKAPFSFLQVEANDERIQQNQEVERVVKVPAAETFLYDHYESGKVTTLRNYNHSICISSENIPV